jgi:CRISPR-associated endonuclease/helicase Cas3
MSETEYAKAFESLTGNPPFPWQWALYDKWFRHGSFPSSCNLPTGLGKTSVVAIWLIALAYHSDKMPRRLVYVVNRRTVVDQTTTEVENLRANLPQLNSSLGSLAISTLRGQFADNREWSADPSRPAVICGTVDMIGSRLLFSGYGCGFKSRPLQAGFLGQDVLLIHDEAHLEPAFQDLLIAIEDEQKRSNEFAKFHVVELSATSRRDGEVFKLSEADGRNEVVKHRIHAAKAVAFHPVDDEKKQLAAKLLELALVHRDKQQAILLFVRTIEAVGTLVSGLRKEKLEVQQLTGTLRGLERDRMADPRKTDACPIFARFLIPPKKDATESERWKIEPKSGTVYLVCTSAGEVGVNISADHLVCDLSTFESMAQRFGRVNRVGECVDTRIDIVHPTDFDDDELETSRSRTLALLQSLGGNGNPSALDSLDPVARLAAFSPTPLILPVSDILFDAWALTTIRDKLPGRPPVAPYLHGISDWELPQTSVAWRSEVWELGRGLEDERQRKEFQKYAAELLDDYPLKAHETLVDATYRLLKELGKLIAPDDTPVWIVADDDTVRLTTLGELRESDKDALEGKTLLLPPEAGGLSLNNKGESTGLLDGSAKFEPEHRKVYDVADEWRDKDGQLRQRKWDDRTKPPMMKLERMIPIRNPDDEDAEPTKTWYWFVRVNASDSPNARSGRQYGLQRHLDDAKSAAEKFLGNLPLDSDLRRAVILAAEFHDLGKDRKLWQQGIGNGEYPAQRWAKSGRRMAAIERSTYRHEFGSLLDVTNKAEFHNVSVNLQELVLHLIAAHHGRARPHFPEDEAFDHEPKGRDVAGTAAAVPGRFARLQQKYGRWGLAYLESLVRAADIAASRKAEGGAL